MSSRYSSSKVSSESLQSICSSTTSHPSNEITTSTKYPSTWTYTELDSKKYVVELSEREVSDVRAAVIKVKMAGLSRPEISKHTFDLGNAVLSQKLSSLSKEIHHGTGIAVLRGLDAARFNDEEAVIAFVGICSHICTERATDSYANQTLSHVRDATKDAVPSWAKGIGLAGSKITAAMDYHSDRFSGDILALHVRNDGGPSAGGDQYVVSFASIYNELLATDPVVLETMAQLDWPFELKQETSTPHVERGPVLFFTNDNKPICQLVRAPLLGSPFIPRDPSMPSLTPSQLHALHAIETLAQRFGTKLDRRQGDIQLIHNLGILHARSAYATTDGKRSTRHLLRMFLRDPENMWDKPKAWEEKFEDAFVKGRVQNIPVLDLDPWRGISGRNSHG